MSDGRVIGVVLGAGAFVGAAVILSRALAKSAGTGSNSPRERPSSPAAPATPTPRASVPRSGGSFDPNYPPEVWLPLVSSLSKTDYPRIPPAIAMRWLTMESDGAPCARGAPGEYGPDGQPREIGLGQIYNPDDFKLLGLTARGVTSATFRAYCASGSSQQRTRLLTDKEMEDQVRYTVLALIDRCMGVADRAVSQHRLTWSMADYWKLAKSAHGLPVIIGNGMPAVVKKLGRAPASWAEFRQVLGMDANATWHFALNNAEQLGTVEL